MTDIPICKVLCKDCQNVLNRNKSWWWTTIEDHAGWWKCRELIERDCKTGTLYYRYCRNFDGKCELFTPVDVDNYNPKEHLTSLKP